MRCSKVKEIHKREGKSYMLVDFKRMGYRNVF